jgi:succinyl-CoA synthetase alpha subunit
MSILVNKDSRIVVQGITGSEGSFHAGQMLAYGSNVVAGVTPGKGGHRAVDDKVPVYDSVLQARNESGANVSIIFVPPAFAAEAILEAAEADIELVVCITEGIPVRDMITVQRFLSDRATRLIGPNCPGIITPGEAKVGIMPGFITSPGRIGIISKSGTLTYEAISQLGSAGFGQSTAIGIGGDPIIGTTMIDLLQLFEHDAATDAIVMIGEIGGQMEIEAARFVKESVSKPVVGFIAGQTAPPGRRMGHAGAIVSGGDDTAAAKMRVMRENGIHVCSSPDEIGVTVSNVLK